MNQSVIEEVAQSPQDDIIRVRGEVVNELPLDLYIPPDALRVFLETFQGPLDLLLYLIKKQNIDILDIPIKAITIQYVQYVELMQELQLELAAEYLLMAAMLAEIKSRLLLPRPPTADDQEGEDPRAELIRRLQTYECFKKAAQDLEELKQVDRDVFLANAIAPPMEMVFAQPDVPMQDLLDAFVGVMTRARMFADHKIEKQILSIRERMTRVLELINSNEFIPFTGLFTVEEGRMGVVVTFIAILELIRQSVIEIVQNEAYGQIYVKAVGDAVRRNDDCDAIE
ncbi:MAG: ScpA family protein [Gammaproteobacteria bacterium]|nr:ScpA family protein [Gammaproteobacteria bacterium]